MNKGILIGLIGSAILAYIIPKLTPYIDIFAKKVSHLLTRDIPARIKAPFRKRKLKKLKEIRELRYNQDAVMFQSIKAHSYFMLFWGVIGFYILLIVMGPLYEVMENNRLMASIYIFPLYVFEVFWLLETKKAKKLVKQRSLLSCNKSSKKGALKRASS